MYISEVSGHRSATLAIEEAVKALSPESVTMGINAFNYTNPISEKIINRLYMGVIKSVPQLWSYLYDNPRVVKKLEKMKTFFEGIANMNELPGAVFILDIRANKTAAREARAMNIPVVALINTDTDPASADYPVPANNRLSEGIRWIMNHLRDSLRKPAVVAAAPERKE